MVGSIPRYGWINKAVSRLPSTGSYWFFDWPFSIALQALFDRPTGSFHFAIDRRWVLETQRQFLDAALDLYGLYRSERDALLTSGKIAGDVVARLMKENQGTHPCQVPLSSA